MKFAIFAVICCLIGASLAYPYPEDNFGDQQNKNNNNQQRWVLDGGYNSDKSGKDVWAQAQAPVWTSDNKRHEVDVVGKYGQHLGGPYGNSEPSWGAGTIYRFRF